MSAEGGAAVIVVPAALVLAPAVLAAAAAAGVVIVVAQGAMWAGEQLHARYVDRCASWGQAEQRLIAESRANIVPLEQRFANALAEFQKRAAAQPDNDGGLSAAQTRQLEAEIQRALAAAQAAPTARAPQLDPHQRELEHARVELAMEATVARQQGIAQEVVTAAESALNGSDLSQIAAARNQLRQAWAAVTETARLLAQQRELATMRLALVKGSSAGLRGLVDSGRLTITPEQSARLSQVDDGVRLAESRLAESPDRARQDAEGLQVQLDELERAILISTNAAGVSGPQARAAQLKGRLTALSDLAREAGIYQYAAPDAWLADINQAKDKLASANPDLNALARTVDGIERRVFAAIDGGQQRALAGQIAEVMTGQGFRQDARGVQAIEIEDLGNGAHRVVGIRNDAQPGMGREDKVVTFTLESNGRLTYDFSGYVGDACHADARAIFDGLRKRGIIITDPRWQAPSGAQLTQAEAQLAPSPDVITNKDQALIASAIVTALHQMGASDDDIQVTSTGGQLHISMSKSGLGYYDFGVNKRGEVMKGTHSGESRLADPLQPLRQVIDAQTREKAQREREQARQREEERELAMNREQERRRRLEEGYVSGDGGAILSE